MTNDNTQQPIETQTEIEDTYDQLEATISDWEWDGASIKDILTFAGSFGIRAEQLLYDHFPEGWPETLPADCADRVTLSVTGDHEENSEDYRTTFFQIMAFDDAGMALTQEVAVCNYTDDETVKYQVMSQDEALVKHEVAASYSKEFSGMRMG